MKTVALFKHYDYVSGIEHGNSSKFICLIKGSDEFIQKTKDDIEIADEFLNTNIMIDDRHQVIHIDDVYFKTHTVKVDGDTFLYRVKREVELGFGEYSINAWGSIKLTDAYPELDPERSDLFVEDYPMNVIKQD